MLHPTTKKQAICKSDQKGGQWGSDTLKDHDEDRNNRGEWTVGGDVFSHRLWVFEEIEDAHDPIVEGRQREKQAD